MVPLSASVHDPAPNPVGEQDVTVVIGWAAVLETAMMAGQLPDLLDDQSRHRLVDQGFLEEEATERRVRQAINDLNHRLRYTLGEYTDSVLSTPVPD